MLIDKWKEQERYVDSLSDNPKILKQHLLLQIRLLENMTNERDFLEKLLKRKNSELTARREEEEFISKKLRENSSTQ